MKSFLRRIYGTTKRLIVPELRYSQYIFEEVLEEYVPIKSAWLDLGCGHHLLPPWRLEQERVLIGRGRQVVGLDYDIPSLLNHKTIHDAVRGSIDRLPFPENHFNVATANMVVEHLDNPREQFKEINRILAPNGLFIFHTVNEKSHFALLRKLISGKMAKTLASYLDDRVSNDIFEVHYKANSIVRIENLAAETGFEVVTIKMISSEAVFALIPPAAVIELIYLKMLMSDRFEKLRTNVIAVLRKSG